MTEEHMIVWEAPAIDKPEFRLYYDDRGHVLFYSGGKPEGNYIVIDAATYAAGRPDLRVLDGKISNVPRGMLVTKLVPSDDGTGQTCAAVDLSIIVDPIESPDVEIFKWKIAMYEL